MVCIICCILLNKSLCCSCFSVRKIGGRSFRNFFQKFLIKNFCHKDMRKEAPLCRAMHSYFWELQQE